MGLDARLRSNSLTKRGPNRRRIPSLIKSSIPFRRMSFPGTAAISKLRGRMPSLPFKHKIPSVRIRKPPQLIRWDIIIMFLCELWGYINSFQLPVILRSPLYRLWGWIFKCNLEESKYPLEDYTCLQDFFSRPLKIGLRPISDEILTSPVDGTILTCGLVTNQIEQVKGQSYTLSNFLGPNFKQTRPNTSIVDENEEIVSILSNKKLFQTVLYLAPGDYHRIHSPSSWIIQKRRHFPGTLLPVAPVVGKIVPQLLALNERVVLTGEWENGFFSLTAVGAYNVGSIRMHFDNVRTNNIKRDYRSNNLQYFSWKGLGTHYYERLFNSISVDKGEEIGLFRLGSTVVLIFEAPENFQFTVKPFQKIKMGETLGTVKSTNDLTTELILDS